MKFKKIFIENSVLQSSKVSSVIFSPSYDFEKVRDMKVRTNSFLQSEWKSFASNCEQKKKNF